MRSSTRSRRWSITTRPITPPLLEAAATRGRRRRAEELHDVGRLAGSEEAQGWGGLAEEHPPVLRTHDRYGNRIDEVEYHPAYHELMTVAVEHGLHAAPWADERPGAHVARAAKFCVWGRSTPGTAARSR